MAYPYLFINYQSQAYVTWDDPIYILSQTANHSPTLHLASMYNMEVGWGRDVAAYWARTKLWAISAPSEQ